MLPIIVAVAYQCMYGTLSAEDQKLIVFIAVTCFLSMGSLLALSFVITEMEHLCRWMFCDSVG